MAFFNGPDLEQGRMLEDGEFPQQGLVPQIFANNDRDSNPSHDIL